MKNKIDITSLRQIERISYFHPECLYVGAGWESGFMDMQLAIDAYKPDVIYYSIDFDYNDAHIPVITTAKKIICMQDYWDETDRRLRIIENGNINGIITKNSVGLDFFKKKFPMIPFRVNPCGYDDEIFTNAPNKKQYDILISGMVSPRYIGRQRLVNIAKTLPSNIKVYQRPHAGWYYQPTVHERYEQYLYAHDLNSSKFAIAGTALEIQAHMQKTWEISATSALCITDLNPKEMEYEKIQKHVYEINLIQSDDEIRSYLIKLFNTYDPNVVNIYNNEVTYANLDNRTIHLLQCIYELSYL